MQGQAGRQEKNIQSISPTVVKARCVSRIGGEGEEMRGTYETFGGSATLVARTICGVSGRGRHNSLRIACPGHNRSMRIGSQWGTDLLPGTWTKGSCKRPANQILSNILYNDGVVRTVIIIPVIRVGTRKRLGIVSVSVVVQDEESGYLCRCSGECRNHGVAPPLTLQLSNDCCTVQLWTWL